MRDILERVTDPKIIEELNRRKRLREQLKNDHQERSQERMPEANGALKTFGKAALNAPTDAIANLLQKTGALSPETRERYLPEDKAYTRGAAQHPIAHALGSLAGFVPVGAATSSGLKAIPTIGRLAANAAPSMLKRSLYHGAEGALLGGLYSNPGAEGPAALMGGGLGALLGGPGVSLARNYKNIKNTVNDITNLEDIQAQRDMAQAGHEEQVGATENLKKQYAEREAGLTTPEAISRKINEREQQHGNLEEHANIPYEENRNLLNWPTGEELPVNANKNVKTSIKDLEQHLGKDTEIDVLGAEKANARIEQRKNFIRENYYKPMEEFANNNSVQLPKTPDLKQIENGLKKFKKDPLFFDILKNVLIAEQKEQTRTVPAKYLIQQWRATKDALNKANRLGFTPGGDNQTHYQIQAMRLKELEQKQFDILLKHFPEQANKLIEGNKLWGEKVMSMYKNPEYNQIVNKGRFDTKNVMHALRGKGRGQEEVKELLFEDPELVKHVIGHTFAKDPMKMLNASPYEMEFINRSPELVEKLNKLKANLRNQDIAKKMHEDFMEKRSIANKGYEESVGQQKLRDKAIKERLKLQDEIKHYKHLKDKLEQQLEAGKISKAKYEELEAKYRNAVSSRQKIIGSVKIGASSIVGSGVVNKISDLMSGGNNQ